MNTAKTILFPAAALLAATLWTSEAAGYSTETVGGLAWSYRIENGGAVLESGEEETPAVAGDIPANLVIPVKLGGRPVTAIGAYACYELWDVESVDIPDSVTSIGKHAFDYTGLLAIDLPASLKTIGECAFCCERLGEGTDYELVIPDGVTDIGKNAFAWCEGVDRVVLPASVTNIGAEVFYECRALAGIEVNASNPAYRGDGGVLYSKDRKTIVCVPPTFSGSFSIAGTVTRIAPGAFTSCRNLASVAIPDGVTDIGMFAFGDCGLKTVRIPASVTNIGWGAFLCHDQEKPSLNSVTVASGNPSYVVSGGALFTKDRKTLVCVPNGKTGHYSIPEGVTRIGGYAFNSCEQLTGITIPDTVTEIEEGAFSGGCEGVTELSIPASVTKIGTTAFTDCSYMTTLSLPSACGMEIGEATFDGCFSLESITIPVGVTNIGKEAFRFCTNLTAVVIPDTVVGIGIRAFAECSRLESLTFPASVTSVGKDVFAECDALKRLCVPSAWKGTDMLARAAVPSGCTIVYVDGASLVLGAAGRSFTADAASGKVLAVTANVSWTAKSSASWLAVKTASGTGNGNITYDVAANSGTSSRTGTITVSGGGLTRVFTVTQSGKTVTLELGASERSFTADAASGKLLAVRANVFWTAKSSASWLTVKTASGTGDGNIEYAVAANTGAARTGTITVSGGGLARVFTVTQDGKTVPVFPDVRDAAGVAAALSGAADQRLGARIAMVEEYDAFRAWVVGKALDPQAVKASAHAWPSYALGAGALFGQEPAIRIGGVSVVSGEGGGPVLEVGVTVRDGNRAVDVEAAKVAGMFEATGDLLDWDGGSKFRATATQTGSDGGTMQFRVVPGDGNANGAFLRIAE